MPRLRSPSYSTGSDSLTEPRLPGSDYFGAQSITASCYTSTGMSSRASRSSSNGLTSEQRPAWFEVHEKIEIATIVTLAAGYIPHYNPHRLTHSPHFRLPKKPIHAPSK